MGCGCTKVKAMRYEFTAPDGSTRIYNSEVEAQAAKIRAKGGTVKAVPA
jgi:hypothetical protein